MAESRIRTTIPDDGLRPEASRGRTQVGGAIPGGGGAAEAGRQRIPTLRQLAALVVNGILTLPRNYRRGMFLDIWV